MIGDLRTKSTYNKNKLRKHERRNSTIQLENLNLSLNMRGHVEFPLKRQK